MAITVQFDTERLSNYVDEYLAQLFHVCQANPADIRDPEAIRAAEEVKTEIVRRWLRGVPVELYAHQASHGCCPNCSGATRTAQHRADAEMMVNCAGAATSAGMPGEGGQ